MKTLKNFFECYFHQNEGFDRLYEIIHELKNSIDDHYRFRLIVELYQVIQTKNYAFAARFIKKYGGRTFTPAEAEQLLNYLYNKLTDQPAYINRSDFVKDYKVVYCPICCPIPEKAKKISLIQKATIIENNVQVYICKPCWLIWLTEDIKKKNAQSYKKYMKSIGLKGLRRELKDVDIL